MRDIFHNKKVLITGGAGTLGSIMTKHISPIESASVIIVDRNTESIQKLKSQNQNAKNITYVPLNIAKIDEFKKILNGIDILYHFAAEKDVVVCEVDKTKGNQGNIELTKIVFEASKTAGVKQFVFTSTDKAVYPISNYGKNKQLAEKYIRKESMSPNARMKSSIVRLVNVLGSSESVTEKFTNSILSRNEICVTDNRMIRFAITKKQAKQLLLKALFLETNGEIITIDAPIIKIMDMALIYQSRYKRNSMIKINIIGIREGERLREFLISDSEAMIAKQKENYIFIPNDYSLAKTKMDLRMSNFGNKMLKLKQVESLLIECNLIPNNP